MDSLTVYHLARELDARWRGGTIRAGHFDRERRTVVLGTDLRSDSGAAVEFDLSAADVVARLHPDAESGGVLAGWMIESVAAPEDDRRLIIALAREGKFKGSVNKRATLEMSFVPAARVAYAHESGRSIARIGGALRLHSAPRPILDATAIDAAVEAKSAAALMQARWVSPMVARWLLAEPGAAVARYARLCALEGAQPTRCGEIVVAYPFCDDGVRVSSLIAGAVDAAPVAAPGDDRRDRALERMRKELDRAQQAPRLRALADSLMSLGEVSPPALVRLPDGTDATVEANEGENAVAVSERLYATVRSMERALASLPERIDAFARAPAPKGSPAPATQLDRQAASRAPSRPFRTYRSTGGLEIWVGRGAESNDTLTFRESSPGDVWLHARDAAGAHVVLRWSRDEPPPAKDLEEAAILAAFHSKSRGSSLAPVDWTRRKYVRKTRGGAPGSVIVQRSETVFVQPDERVERKLRDT